MACGDDGAASPSGDGGVAEPGIDAAPDGGATPARDDILVRSGTGLIPLGVTGDGHVVYQDGKTVYASALRAGADPIRIDDVPAGNTAFAYISGNVAFVWTNPDYNKPGFGVSPLTIWSFAHGARQVSDSSPVGTLVTAASDDGRRVVFPTASDAEGTRADLVLASADLREQQTLITAMKTSFPSGPCRPEALFLGGALWGQVAAAYCTGDQTAPTISIWWGQGQRDFPGMASPPRMFVHPYFPVIATISAPAPGATFGAPTMVSVFGRQAIEDVPSTLAFFGADGTALYLDASAGPQAPRALRGSRTPGVGSGRLVASALRSVFGFGAGSESLHTPPTSPDGRWLIHSTTFDPETGLSDLVVADVHAADASDLAVDPTPRNVVLPGNPFTADSRFVITNRITDPATGAGPLVATKLPDLAPREISDERAAFALPAADSVVVVGDAVDTSAASSSDFTAQLTAVDLSGPTALRKPIAKAARLSVYLTPGRRGVVYSTDEAGRAGIHLAAIAGPAD